MCENLFVSHIYRAGGWMSSEIYGAKLLSVGNWISHIFQLLAFLSEKKTFALLKSQSSYNLASKLNSYIMTQQQQLLQRTHEDFSRRCFFNNPHISYILNFNPRWTILKNVNIRCSTVAMTRASSRRFCVGECAVVVRRLLSTPHDFPESFTEVLGEEGVQERIETGVCIRQALTQNLDRDCECCRIVKLQWFQHQDDLNRCPTNCKGDHLRGEKLRNSFKSFIEIPSWSTLKTCEYWKSEA